MIKFFNSGEIVEILDNSTPKLFRKAIILKQYDMDYEVMMLDCDDTQIMPLNKIRKITYD
tara:strand:- start:606 stop:785 length:180 start_codon:yes stop_codon:yes gene_type:complete